MDGWSFKKKLSSWQGLKENKMEGAHSHFITEDVKDKPASVKMDLEICELYYKAIEVLLSKEGYGNSIKDIRRFLLLFIHSNNSLSKKQKSLKKVIVPKKELLELKNKPFFTEYFIFIGTSTCFSSAVACHFRKLLGGNPLVLKELKSKKTSEFVSWEVGAFRM
ncbi:uncharacterized protein TNCT_676961 [Trichonephila clavata]|uniref:Uncharacterized protein n=1 Tax=Trichonephila clavata TaxID=2740835 RepID=A0A8X6FE67_TRICU|nr:uncharacterized protein TNCT_676961 [Trichonephila clavata]